MFDHAFWPVLHALGSDARSGVCNREGGAVLSGPDTLSSVRQRYKGVASRGLPSRARVRGVGAQNSAAIPATVSSAPSGLCYAQASLHPPPAAAMQP
jgi:hypothetical protein